MKNKSRYCILVGYDFSPLADRAVLEAFELARGHAEGEVHVVSVHSQVGDYTSAGIGAAMTPLPLSAAPTVEMLRGRIDALLEEWAQKTGGSFARLDVHSRSDQAAPGILDLADDLDVDLIVLGTHGRRGVRRLLFGSVAEDVLRGARCPVYVVPAERDEPPAPRIEPPCPDCLAARAETAGQEQWCARHREHHTFGHALHYESRVGAQTRRTIL
jgi:nucleotide-binding universal stress UspA family protein